MKTGGYQIINLENKNLALNTGMVYPGIYEKIEGTRKPIYVSGLQVANVEYHDAYVAFSTNESNFVGDIYGLTIEVQNNDVLTVKKN